LTQMSSSAASLPRRGHSKVILPSHSTRPCERSVSLIRDHVSVTADAVREIRLPRHARFPSMKHETAAIVAFYPTLHLRNNHAGVIFSVLSPHKTLQRLSMHHRIPRSD